MNPSRIEESFPLSPLQEGMLFNSLHLRDTPPDVVYCVLGVQEELDRECFATAWRQMVERHPALRTGFRWVGLEQPLQEVHAEASLTERWEDWSEEPPAERERRWKALVIEERTRPFDMARPPLSRLSVARLGHSSFRFLWIAHHALVDGTSLNLVVQEVLARYDTLRHGAPPLERTSPRMRTWVEWLAGRDVRASERFWKEHLSGLTGPTPLGFDRGARTGTGGGIL